MTIKQNFLGDVTVDVLVVGAGPAGFMAAVTLARYGVSFGIIDQRPLRVQTGHAGGKSPFLAPIRLSTKEKISWFCRLWVQQLDR